MNKECLIAFGLLLLVSAAGLGFYFTRGNGGDGSAYELTKPFVTNIVKKTVATGSIKPRKEVMIKP